MGVPGDWSSKNGVFVEQVTREDVRLTVQALNDRSAVLRDLVEAGQLAIVGAMHDVATGRVSFGWTGPIAS